MLHTETIHLTHRIKGQLDEQIEAYKELIFLIKNHVSKLSVWQAEITKPHPLKISIRKHGLDYVDTETLVWNLLDPNETPVRFS